MAPREALEMIDDRLQSIMNSPRKFGGKVVVLGGDFRQVLPVIPRGSRSALVSASIKRSTLWPLFQVRKLTKNIRVDENEIAFAQWLLDMGDGLLPGDDGDVDIPTECLSSKYSSDGRFSRNVTHDSVSTCLDNGNLGFCVFDR
jgi:hypothetical protein